VRCDWLLGPGRKVSASLRDKKWPGVVFILSRNEFSGTISQGAVELAHGKECEQADQ